MAINKLTDAACKRAGPGPKKYSDGHGMYLFVTPTGGKVWRMDYKIQGKAQTQVLGPYPLLGLADARKKRDEVRLKLLGGVDPRARQAHSKTLSEAVALYWAGRKDVTPRYTLNATSGLAMHLEGALGSVPVSLITRETLLAPLMVLDAQGKHSYSRKVRMWASQVFDWAKEQGYCGENPAALINPRRAFGHARVKHHAALKLSEVPDFLARLAMERELQSVLACRMLMLTWVRTGELRFMLWSEIEGNLWRIPAEKMKRVKEHLVPLPEQALDLLAELKARSRGSVYVFPGDRRIDRPMSENSILYMLGRIGYQGLLTGHGMRTIASTWGNENGYAPDAIERQLAHTPDDKIRSAYNSAEYLPARRKMLADFADWLDRLQNGAASPAP